MPLVVGITFRRVGKVYYFDPGEFELHEGDFVIAETARGVEFGEVAIEPRAVPDEELVAPLKRVVRVATGDDLEREAANRDREKHAFEVCERKIAEHRLPMKLLESEYAFDGSQVTFAFSADGRVDFRELVKDVAGALKSKVQLHQIGVRDEAKLIGGYGTCGRQLCCSTFLSNFEPVSMKMAKDQSLFLNPAKFSGCCGKLMCCLRYEHEHYKLSQKRMPMVGAIIPLENGRGKVVDVNVISNVITVQTEDDAQRHIHASQLELKGLCRRHGIACNMSEQSCVALTEESEALDSADDEDDLSDDVVPVDIDSDANVINRPAPGQDKPRGESGPVARWRTPGQGKDQGSRPSGGQSRQDRPGGRGRDRQQQGQDKPRQPGRGDGRTGGNGGNGGKAASGGSPGGAGGNNGGGGRRGRRGSGRRGNGGQNRPKDQSQQRRDNPDPQPEG